MLSYLRIADWLAAVLSAENTIRSHIIGAEELLTYVSRTAHEERLHDSFCSALPGLEIGVIEHEGKLFGPQLHLFDPAAANLHLIDPEESRLVVTQHNSGKSLEINTFPRDVMVADTSGAVISTEWPPSLIDYALEHIFFHNQNLVCLEPVMLGAHLKLQVLAIGPLAVRVPACKKLTPLLTSQ